MRRVTENNALTLTIDTADKKSPEKMLLKLSDKINEMECNELLNLERENIFLGSDLNEITHQK